MELTEMILTLVACACIGVALRAASILHLKKRIFSMHDAIISEIPIAEWITLRDLRRHDENVVRLALTSAYLRGYLDVEPTLRTRDLSLSKERHFGADTVEFFRFRLKRPYQKREFPKHPAVRLFESLQKVA